GRGSFLGAFAPDCLCQGHAGGGAAMSRRTGPPGPPKGQAWIWHTLELRQSPAWRALSLNERRLLDRLEIEHMRHGGTENGNLGVSKEQFAEFGVSRRLVSSVVAHLVALGLLVVTSHGTGGRGPAHVNRYR